MQCFQGTYSVLRSLRPRTTDEITQDTLCKIKVTIEQLNLKIMQLKGEKKMTDERFDKVMDECNGHPDMHQTEEMKNLIWRSEDIETRVSALRKQVTHYQKEESTVQSFLFNSDSALATEDIQRNINKLKLKFNPARLNAAHDARQQNESELSAVNDELHARMDASDTRDMDTSRKLEERLVVRQQAALLDIKDPKYRVATQQQHSHHNEKDVLIQMPPKPYKEDDNSLYSMLA